MLSRNAILHRYLDTLLFSKWDKFGLPIKSGNVSPQMWTYLHKSCYCFTDHRQKGTGAILCDLKRMKWRYKFFGLGAL